MTLYALFKLGWHFIKRLMGRLFGVNSGIESFLDNYKTLDHLSPTCPNESDILLNLSRCTGCLKCDEVRLAHSIVRPSDLIIRYTRLPGQYEALSLALNEFSDTELSLCTARCPEHIDFHELNRLPTFQ